MTNLPQKNVNSIQFGKEIVHVNHVLIPGSSILKEKSREHCSFSVDAKRTVKLQNFGILRYFLGRFRKSSAIVGSSSETLALGRKKISHLWLGKSWQVYDVTDRIAVKLRKKKKAYCVQVNPKEKLTGFERVLAGLFFLLIYFNCYSEFFYC